MEVLIVGAGKMARAIGTRLLAGGHQLRIAGRNHDEARTLAAELNGDATGEPLGDPLGAASVVILALPYPADRMVAEQLAGDLVGRVVVDIANPVNFGTFDDLTTPTGVSAAEEVAKAASGAKVVKAFNTTLAGRLAAGGTLDVFLAGDDERARDTVAALVADGGMRPIDVGGLKHAHTLEAFQMLCMKVQDQIGGNWSTSLELAPG
ncbi:NADPH-dependent F420 reductase [Actinocatenispora rupis]|uniref:NADP oxidoreductase n=1 Tax=Actinocatenispora rupis TaxID=519421 RepID=A0A8J3ND68_9ACTN|nr:NAD(P)-binding domain-containing protein [Actinocatenispora rupis]GID12562.1 NADP oxidoreductase [Actinocatenispora rupis]